MKVHKVGLQGLDLVMVVNLYMSSILFVGHRQTVQTHIRCGRMRHLIRVSTVCLGNALLKFE